MQLRMSKLAAWCGVLVCTKFAPSLHIAETISHVITALLAICFVSISQSLLHMHVADFIFVHSHWRLASGWRMWSTDSTLLPLLSARDDATRCMHSMCFLTVSSRPCLETNPHSILRTPFAGHCVGALWGGKPCPAELSEGVSRVFRTLSGDTPLPILQTPSTGHCLDTYGHLSESI